MFRGLSKQKNEEERIMNYFAMKSEEGYVQSSELIKRKMLIYGEKTMLGEFIQKKGAYVKSHAHKEEQIGYLVRGSAQVEVEGQSAMLHEGDCWIIPGNAKHSMEFYEDSMSIEVYSPPREDYMPVK
jgi:quercetin dioxygenase-like cupin family protein